MDGANPIARTNVAPVVGAPTEPSLHAFSYTVPSDTPGPPTFVVAGSGELLEGGRSAEAIVRRGETSPDAMAAKAAHVMATQHARLTGLGGAWSDVTRIDIYTAFPIHPFLASGILERMARPRSTACTGISAGPPSRGSSTRWTCGVSARRCTWAGDEAGGPGLFDGPARRGSAIVGRAYHPGTEKSWPRGGPT